VSAWRVIVTDTERPSGVAPVCPAVASGGHLIPDSEGTDETGVYDCCPGPHIECWSESTANEVSKVLTAAEAEVCS